MKKETKEIQERKTQTVTFDNGSTVRAALNIVK